MNLVEELLKADEKKADELEKGIFNSKKLAKLLGKEKTVEVEISEISARRFSEISSLQMTKNGNVDFGKTFDTKLILCIEGCVNPDMKNKDLQKHFGCRSAKELCEKLFGSEVHDMSDKISSLCGVTEDVDEEIKN